MKRDDLDIIKKVIEEEGMRRDIGMLIDQSFPLSPAKSWWATLKGKILLITAISVLGIAGVVYYNYTQSEELYTAEVQTNLEQDSKSSTMVEGEDSSINERGGNSFLVEGTPKEASEKETNGKELKKPKSTTRSSSDQSNQALASGRNRKAPLFTSGGNIFINEDTQPPVRPIINESRVKGTKDGNGNDQNIVRQNDIPTSTPLTTTKAEEQNTVTDATGDENDKDEAPHLDSKSNALTYADSTTQSPGANTTSSSEDNIEHKWDAALGGGYAFLSTGDIRTLTGNIDVNYRLTTKWALSAQSSFGSSIQPKKEGEATFLQGNVLAYYSPFGNDKVSDFRLGAGAGYYAIDHTFISSSTTINGVEVIDYVNEKRNDVGYTFSIENRYAINNRILLGLGVYTIQYLNEDAISGVKLNLGYTF